MRVFFLVDYLYYLPQFLPVAWELRERGAEVILLLRGRETTWSESLEVIREGGHDVEFSEDPAGLLREQAPEWVVFGNGFDKLDQLAPTTRTATLYHGIGVKECYYSRSLCQTDVRFVEGPYRRLELEKRFPDARFEEVGFAKLDAFFSGDETPSLDIEELGLDAELPTILYAPTFYPSSIECMPPDLPQQLHGLNFLVKAHEFTWTKKRYAAQRKLLERWESQENVHLAPPVAGDIRPYMGVADLLISEASSVLFEFAALDRPIVWCDFLKLRWTSRGLLRHRFQERMDPQMSRWEGVAAHAETPGGLAAIVRAELDSPERFHRQRVEATEHLIGPTDGLCAKRIADVLLG